MKIALCSDIHLEYDGIEIHNSEDSNVLVLAGDICVAEDLHDHPNPDKDDPNLSKRQRAALRYRKFFSNISEEFKNIIYVAGNHELYHGRWNASLDHLIEECIKYPNIHFLEDGSKEIDGKIFIGSTLWTNLNKGDPLTMHAIVGLMNDYKLIRNDSAGFRKIKPSNVLMRHHRSLEYFKREVEKNYDKDVVIVSHMAPSSLSIDDRYKREYISNSAYYSDLSDFILDHSNIKLWLHGHVHDDFDYTIGNTRVVCNPRGYVGYERPPQSEDPYFPKIIEL